MGQPSGYSLSRANVTITLSEENNSEGMGRNSRDRHIQPSLSSEYAVQVTEFFGPQSLAGVQTTRHEVEDKAINPTIAAGELFEVSGMGVRRTVSRDRTDCWTFKGTRKRAKHGVGLRTLVWELRESGTEKQLHNHVFYTAFAFEHSKNPVIMCVEVEGRLRSMVKQSKHNILQFCSQSGTSNNSMYTRIDFSSSRPITSKRLDNIARGLNMAMQRENIEAVPVEVPGPTTASFQQLSHRMEPGHKEPLTTTATDDLRDPHQLDINKLEEILHGPIFPETQNITSEREDEIDLAGSEDTFVEGIPSQTVSRESPRSAQALRKAVQVVALVLIQWLMSLLEATGSVQYTQHFKIPTMLDDEKPSQPNASAPAETERPHMKTNMASC
ncbi:hypothetical protein GCG54_00004904 [Colletotrichum gloeosporioides]|uniref:Uncharacterized protein n=1 Tax=Colletotrichum gloeosporioides TaxID=474922 RepID=A0A8H4CGT1_COLGL|nr:uncharacterized protein GCG54_00004904 [Colletotrichum gloeosporioides]KAF3803725.1 hypothetical protein GCG54_00004904 [Colletotrichum gloeosporioides]